MHAMASCRVQISCLSFIFASSFVFFSAPDPKRVFDVLTYLLPHTMKAAAGTL